MDEEDGRSGALAAQTGQMGALSDVPAVGLCLPSASPFLAIIGTFGMQKRTAHPARRFHTFDPEQSAAQATDLRFAFLP